MPTARRCTRRRLVLAELPDKAVVGKLFDTLAPRFAERPGGYTRILRVGYPSRRRRRSRAHRAGRQRVQPARGREAADATRKRRSRRPRALAIASRRRRSACAAARSDVGGSKGQAGGQTRGAARKSTTPRKAGGIVAPLQTAVDLGSPPSLTPRFSSTNLSCRFCSRRLQRIHPRRDNSRFCTTLSRRPDQRSSGRPVAAARPHEPTTGWIDDSWNDVRARHRFGRARAARRAERGRVSAEPRLPGLAALGSDRHVEQQRHPHLHRPRPARECKTRIALRARVHQRHRSCGQPRRTAVAFGIGGVPMRVIERPYIKTAIAPPGNADAERNTTRTSGCSTAHG